MNNITQHIDRKVLAHVVQRALDSDAATLDTWHAQRIDYANVSPHSRGLYRVIGMARDGEVIHAWSLVLKVFATPTNSAATDPAAAFYWKREVLAYQSGFLADLPGGLAAPHCFGVIALSNNQLGLWLEDVQPPRNLRWTISRYALAARHFGAFGGAYLVERSIPAASWLSRHVISAWVAESASLVELIQRPGVWTHPLLQRAFPEAILTQYLEGLRAAGWQGNPQAISYAFYTAAVLRCVFSTACWPAAIMRDESKRYVVETEQRWGLPIEQIVEQWAAVTRFLLGCAEVARAMLHTSSAYIHQT